MENNQTTAGKTAQYPKTMTIIRDCHWSHNTVVNVENRVVERFLRQWARLMGFQMANVRTVKPAIMRKEVAI